MSAKYGAHPPAIQGAAASNLHSIQIHFDTGPLDS